MKKEIMKMSIVIIVLVMIVFVLELGLECSKTTTEIVIEDKWREINYGFFKGEEFYFADQEGYIYKIAKPNRVIKKYSDLSHIRFEGIQEDDKYMVTYTNLGFRCSIKEEEIK